MSSSQSMQTDEELLAIERDEQLLRESLATASERDRMGEGLSVRADATADNPALAGDDQDEEEPTPRQVRQGRQGRQGAGKKRASRSPEATSSSKRKTTRQSHGVSTAGPPIFATPAASSQLESVSNGEHVRLMKGGVIVERSAVFSESEESHAVHVIKAYVEEGTRRSETAAMAWLSEEKWPDRCFRTVCYTNKGKTAWTGGLTDDMTCACKTCQKTGCPCLIMKSGTLVLLPGKGNDGNYDYCLK